MEFSKTYYKDMVDAMTYDGNMLFGHDRRNYIPLPEIRHERMGYWSQSYYERNYAEEVHVPSGYMIVDPVILNPSLDTNTIWLNNGQIAIPLKALFKLKDFDLHQQWELIKYNRTNLPSIIRKAESLEKALKIAYDIGMENMFMKMFYDMKRDDLDEFKRRKRLLTDKRNAVKNEMRSCLSEINRLRAVNNDDWPKMFDDLYCEYSSSRFFGSMNFCEYCEFASKRDVQNSEVLEATRKIHSVAWYISVITEEYVRLDDRLMELGKRKEFEASRFTFE